MPTIQNRPPSIAATSSARNAGMRDNHTLAQSWAARGDLSGHRDEEIRSSHAVLLGNEQALKPFYSVERVAYRKLSAEMQRRNLTPQSA